MNKHINNFIKNKLFRKDGKLNTKRIENNGKWLFKNYIWEYEEIIRLTKFLDDYYDSPTFSQRVWHIYYNKFYPIKCEWCHTEVVSFNWFSRGYFRFCCPKCASNISGVQRSEKYHNKSDEEKQRIRNKQSKTHRSKTKEEKREILQRKKITVLENWGVENVFDIIEIQEKSKETKRRKYCDENFNNRVKYKETMLKNYGVENPSHNEEIMNKILKNSLKTKSYILPSGKEIKLQGYEPQAMDELLNYYDEEDILYKIVDVPTIWYKFEEKDHKYYPDFYIPKENLIIEVKSTWTLNKEHELNMAKFKKVEECGFNFKLMVISRR